MQVSLTDEKRSEECATTYENCKGTSLIELLTAEEERELAEKNRKGDKSARERLILANLKLVNSISKKYVRIATSMTLQDLMQEGDCGLMKAVERYDPTMGYRFSTYAAWWIRDAITRALLDQDRIVRLPDHMTRVVKKVQTAVLDNKQKEGEERLNLQQLAEELGLDFAELQQILQIDTLALSLDAPIVEDGTVTVGDFLQDRRYPSPEDAVFADSVRGAIARQLENLRPKEKRVLEMRYGFENDRIYTLHEVGEYLGVSGERARQIEAEAIRKLRMPKWGKGLEDLL